MTAPQDTTTTTPPADTTPPAGAAPTPPAAPAGDKPTGDGTDWKAEARKWEERAKENKTALTQATGAQNTTAQQLEQIAQLLGLKKGETADPVKLAEQLTGKDAELRQSRVDLAVHRKAGRLGANPDALLDSLGFRTSVRDLDPSAKDFDQSVESAIKDAVKANASLKATPTGPAVSGGDFTGGTGAGAPITDEQLSKMTPAEITKAYNDGKLKHLM